MGKDIRWRFLLIVVIVGACLWAIVPPAQKTSDLPSGVQAKAGAFPWLPFVSCRSRSSRS